MSKRILFLFLAAILLVGFGAAALAGGRQEASVTELPAGPLLPWTGSEIVWSGFGADLGMVNDPSTPVYAEYLQGTGNARVEWETAPWGDYDTKLTLYMSSGDLPDIVWARDSVTKAFELGDLGMFLDWNQFLDRMPNVERYAEEYPHFNHVVTEDGERFAINDLANAEYIGEGWFYNPVVLERAGIPGPPETMEEMIEQIKTIKERVPGVDGYLSYWGMGYVLNAFGSAMNVRPANVRQGIAYDTDRGEWIHHPTMNPDYRLLLEYLHELYQADAFNPDAIAVGVEDERVNELLEAGNYAFIYWYYFELENKWGEHGEEPPVVGMRPPSHRGHTYYHITVPHDAVGNWGYMSPRDVKMPEVLASYVDNIMSFESYMLFTWGIEGLTYDIGPDGAPRFLDTYDAAGRRDLGVGNFWDVRYIKFDDRYGNWFASAMPPESAAHAPAVEDVRRLQRGEMVPIWNWSRPLMTPEQNAEIARIMTPINTFIEEEQLKFITGARSMEEFDQFVAQINRMGNLDRVLEYYNGGHQWLMGDRRYPRIP